MASLTRIYTKNPHIPLDRFFLDRHSIFHMNLQDTRHVVHTMP
jgi:hypothetical protein